MRSIAPAVVAVGWLMAAACHDLATPPPVPPPPVAPVPAPVPAPASPPSVAQPVTPAPAAAIAHGGLGSPIEASDGPRRAVDAALAALEHGADALDAAVEGVVVLEDDPRFDAGTGSFVRIDGRTVQMDASVMASDGRFGAVAGIEAVKNPVRVARAVVDSPHLLLAGDGATRFARTLGMPPYDPATPAARAESRRLLQRLAKGERIPPGWDRFDWRGRWNFERPLTDALRDAGHDTVGVAVRSADGRFAVALSTGGTRVTLRGRIGDVPIYGAGEFAGPSGAAAATGVGERIVEADLSRSVHRWLEAGASPQEAAQRAVETLRPRTGIGIIVMGRSEMAAAAAGPMAWAGRELGSDEWRGPPLPAR